MVHSGGGLHPAIPWTLLILGSLLWILCCIVFYLRRRDLKLTPSIPILTVVTNVLLFVLYWVFVLDILIGMPCAVLLWTWYIIMHVVSWVYLLKAAYYLSRLHLTRYISAGAGRIRPASSHARKIRLFDSLFEPSSLAVISAGVAVIALCPVLLVSDDPTLVHAAHTDTHTHTHIHINRHHAHTHHIHSHLSHNQTHTRTHTQGCMKPCSEVGYSNSFNSVILVQQGLYVLLYMVLACLVRAHKRDHFLVLGVCLMLAQVMNLVISSSFIVAVVVMIGAGTVIHHHHLSSPPGTDDIAVPLPAL